MSTHAILRLTHEPVQERLAGLVDLLVDAVEGGASVNFVQPMTRAKALAWWAPALASQARGERLILVAERAGRVDGTVQLVLAPQENQPFRADLAKMPVHRRARQQGFGAALLRAAEAEARALGRVLRTLDTEAGSAGERLYAQLGWTKFGEIPGYALGTDGSRRETAAFFYRELER
ncbi:MAG: GNAT family N-acetyltransferase [Geminicoccaceae bacterium]